MADELVVKVDDSNSRDLWSDDDESFAQLITADSSSSQNGGGKTVRDAA